MIQVSQIKNLFSHVIKWNSGADNIAALNVRTATHCLKDSLCFVSNDNDLQTAIQAKAAIIIAWTKCSKTETPPGSSALFFTDHIQMAMSLILPSFDQKLTQFSNEQKIHPSAVVHPTAQIHSSVLVGPNCVIGAGVDIGENTIIHPLVFIGANTKIGKNCQIHPHSSIGADGYGYATDKEYTHHKIPQIGNVILEDNVEIGANCAIDRATLTSTIIRQGTKIDNLVHIAHNVEIGEQSLITAGFFTAGSTKIGKRFMTGGNTVVSDHVTIADNVTVAGRSTILSDIKEPGQYGGHPLVPMNTYLKNLAILKNLVQLKQKISNKG